MAAKGGLSTSNRFRSSAEKCCASAADPPLPHARILPPARRQLVMSAIPLAIGSDNSAAAADLRLALAEKCPATRAMRSACNTVLSSALPIARFYTPSSFDEDLEGDP